MLRRDDSADRANTLLLIAVFAIAKIAFHTIVNQHYGFHRDELATLDDARHLAWGYVAYPPLTPFVGRMALQLFGESLAGFRFFAVVAQSVALLLTADMARQLGGSRPAQWIAAIAVAVAPISLGASSLFQYVSFDYLWWVVIAWGVIRLIDSGDKRWWLAIGGAIGAGVLTKYSMLFFVAGIVAGVLLTPLRSALRSPWLWAGVALSLLVAAPNLVWQARHDFITVEFLKSIHARDIAIGRTSDFLVNQLFVPANPVTIPLWSIGLTSFFAASSFRRFRILGWMAVVPFCLFMIAKGRDYYTGPIYPMLFAAGAVWIMGTLKQHPVAARWVAGAAMGLMLVAGAAVASVVLPLAPIGTPWWQYALEKNGDLREEIGWPEQVAEVARIWKSLPQADRQHAAILCANYGEAGAIGLYGPHEQLPPAISAVNSYWARGYGDPPPEVVIVIGARRERLMQRFESVEVAGHTPNPLHVNNEESEHPDIYLCRRPRKGWSVFWPAIRSFG